AIVHLGLRDATLVGWSFGGQVCFHLADFLLRTYLQMPSWCAVAWYESHVQTDLTHLPGNITQPVLQVVGGADRVTSREGARWLAERLADARVIELDGVGHYPRFEAGAEFRPALLEFVSAHRANRIGLPEASSEAKRGHR